MTRKKKDKEKVEMEQDADNQPEVYEKVESEKIGDDSTQNTAEEIKEEIKQLEGEVPPQLEYFSKDELIKKLGDLEDELKDTKENLKKFEKDSEDWKNKYMRLQAEFENSQKRWNKNQQNMRLEYTASTLKSFLPLYDSFKKALEKEGDDHVLLKGFYDQFMSILKSHKAEPIEVQVNDPFDYMYHEALTSLEKEDVPNNTILEIIQDGWKMDKNVIRYAKVVISKEPKPPEPEEQAEDSEIVENGKTVENNVNPKDDKEGTSSPVKPEEKSKAAESDLEDEYIR